MKKEDVVVNMKVEPSVELDGKQYAKTQLLDALAKLEGK